MSAATTTPVSAQERTGADALPRHREPALARHGAPLAPAPLGRRERLLFLGAIALVAIHVVDDNYLQLQPGTSPSDHLASGLVPVAILGLAALLHRYLRPGFRAATALTIGALAIAIGAPGAYYLTDGTASGDHYSGLLSLAASAALLASGPLTLWRSRRRDRRGRRRALTVAVGLASTVAVSAWLVFPISLAYIYTHTGRTTSEPDPTAPYRPVTLTTSDSLELEAWYAPSRNRAAVIVYPGPSRTDEARILLDHGYGVLLIEPRGQGESEGDIVRWAGDRDLHAGTAYLQNRADVDPERIGAIGFSIGGEMLLEAAAQSTAYKAVISEGAGSRIGDEDTSGIARLLSAPTLAVMTAAVTILSNHRPPPSIIERIGQIAPRPLLLVYADPGAGGESTRQPRYYAAAGQPKSIWNVPGATHTGGIDAQPAEYERRLIGFLDQALLGTAD